MNPDYPFRRFMAPGGGQGHRPTVPDSPGPVRLGRGPPRPKPWWVRRYENRGEGAAPTGVRCCRRVALGPMPWWARRCEIRGEGAGAWLLPLKRPTNHGLLLAGAPPVTLMVR